jgi:adenylylsulfate kinase
MTKKNTFPDQDNFIARKQKEKRINQKGLVIWFTGLSGSGKSTLALELEKGLVENGYLTEVLDGDKIRNGLNSDLGFSAKDRLENIRRIAEVSKLFCNTGIITLSAFISPTIEIRKMAREIIGNNDFFEVFVNTPLGICEERDVKGLYKKARAGFIQDFTGISAPYEEPINPDIDIKTENRSVEVCADEIFKKVLSRLRI